MSLDLSSFLQSRRTPDEIITLLYELYELTVSNLDDCHYVFDDESIKLIYCISSRIPGHTLQSLVDTIVLRLMPHVTVPAKAKKYIFLDVITNKSADVILAYLDHVDPFMHIDLLRKHDNIIYRPDIELDQIVAILRKWWMKIDRAAYVAYATRMLRLIYGYPRTFVTAIENNENLEHILRCLHELPGFLDNMSFFIDIMFINVMSGNGTSNERLSRLRILCTVGFIPSHDLVIKTFLNRQKNHCESLQIIALHHPVMVNTFIQIDYISRCLLQSYQSDDHIAICMLAKLGVSVLDYICPALVDDVGVAIHGSHLKLYGLHHKTPVKCFFQNYVPGHLRWFVNDLHVPPMFRDVYRLGERVKAVDEYVRKGMIDTLLQHSRNCNKILNGIVPKCRVCANATLRGLDGYKQYCGPACHNELMAFRSQSDYVHNQ